MNKSFEGIRGAAAVMVALYHLQGAGLLPRHANWLAIIPHSYIFVDLFFVLSGYVITNAYQNRLGSYGEVSSFIVRRFGRLFPLLIFSTIAYVATENIVSYTVKWLTDHGVQIEHSADFRYSLPTFWEILSTLTLTSALGFFHKNVLNYASWSISTEFYGYLLFVVAWRIIGKSRRFPWLLFISSAGFVLTDFATVALHHCTESYDCGDISYDFGLTRCIGSFFLGVTVWLLPALSKAYIKVIQGLAVGIIGLIFFLANAFPIAMLFCPVAFAMLIYAVAADSGAVANFFSRRGFQILGQRSYSIYLLHPVLILVMYPLMHQIHSKLYTTICILSFIPILIIVSGWTFSIIENPLREYFNMIASKVERRNTFASALSTSIDKYDASGECVTETRVHVDENR